MTRREFALALLGLPLAGAPLFAADRRRFLRFGGKADVLILGLHGGTQTIHPNALPYLNFRKMSALERIATDSRVVILPQARNRLWQFVRRDDVDFLEELIDRERPRKVYAVGFSMGGTFLLHANRYLKFDGIATCGAVLPPFENGNVPPHHPVDSLILQGLRDRKKNIEHAARIHRMLGQVGRFRLEYLDIGHVWPADKNRDVLDYFGI